VFFVLQTNGGRYDSTLVLSGDPKQQKDIAYLSAPGWMCGNQQEFF
jgi:hypothetical protein